MLRTMLCRVLMILMAWMPYQFAQASMIGTEQAATAASTQARTHVMELLNRAEVASQMQTMGVDVSTAKERVAAMTDEEVTALSNRLEALPAGGISNGWLLVIVIAIAAAVWWNMGGRTTR